jgi:hypothetical protein
MVTGQFPPPPLNESSTTETVKRAKGAPRQASDGDRGDLNDGTAEGAPAHASMRQVCATSEPAGSTLLNPLPGTVSQIRDGGTLAPRPLNPINFHL